MIGPLLASVARNITVVGLPEALSGPVRRGDAAAVARHLEALSKHPGIRDFYRAGVLAQIPMAAMLGEGPPNGLREIQALIAHGGRKPIRSALIPRKR